MLVKSHWPLGALLAVFTLGLFALSPGLFTIDEFIYFAGADAMARSGSFIVQNGIEGVQSDQLSLVLLVEGPSGLTPQYPPGMAILGAPLLSFFGMHGLMLINTISAALTVYLLYKAASRHFGGHKVGLVSCALLLGATFFLEYAFAVWPHAISVMCVTWAFSLTLDAVKAEASLIGRSIATGALIGFGMLFRTDAVLVLPAIGIVLFLYASKPFQRSILLATGLAPIIVVVSAVNFVKFGTLNPLSYGRTGGGAVSFGDHFPALLSLALAGIVFLALRFSWSRIKRKEVVFWSVGVLVLLLAVIAHDFTLRYLHGFWGLVVDATILQDSRPGVVYLENGTVSFWGLWKKALGQSMPWLAVLFGLAWGARDVDKRVKLSILILAVIWSLPFFPKDWHGGMSSNMRYFLPLLPWICALAAKLLIELVIEVNEPVRKLLMGALIVALAEALWFVFSHTGFAGVNQIFSTWVFGLVATLAFITGFATRYRLMVQTGLLVVIGSGLTLSSQLTMFDFLNAQYNRHKSLVMSKEHHEIPDRSLAYVPSRFLLGWALKPGNVAALPTTLHTAPTRENDVFDYDLIGKALGDGYRVFVARHYVTDGLRNREGLRLMKTDIGLEDQTLLEIKSE